MAVGRADHAELVRVGPQLLLKHQPVFQRFAGIFVLQHLVLLGRGQVEVALIPGLIIGELVVRREEGMRFAVTLDLGDLVQRLPLGACLERTFYRSYDPYTVRRRET